jgi:hypothetical protein
MVGMPSSGATIGTGLGAALSRWLGMGDYTVNQNSIVSRASNSVPSMHKNDQTVVIRHREYIGPISGTTSFAVAYELPINPGLASTFPWLSGIATNFQEYKIRGMVYHYVPTSGTAISGTNSALGAVMIQTSYRATESAPASKVTMLNEYWANEVVPSDTMAHPIECDPKENPFAVHYVRSGNIPSGDLLLYDVGKTFVATQGMQGTNVVGDLWVTYEVELKKPMVTSNVISPSLYYSARWFGGLQSNLFQGPIFGPIVGTLNITTGVSNVITIPRGTFGEFTISVTMSSAAGLTTSAANWWSSAPTYSNCGPSTRISDAGAPYGALTYSGCQSSIGAVEKLATYVLNVRKTDAGTDATVTIPGMAITGGLIEWVALVVTNRPLE